MKNLTWIDPLLRELNKQFNFLNYDYRIIILGKAGPIIPQIGEKEKYFFDNYMTAGDIMGYYYTGTNGVIVMTENGLKIPSYYRIGELGFARMPGWQQIIHEILHSFGAVDVYESGFNFHQINNARLDALKLEPESEVDKSIMSNGWGGYCNKYFKIFSCQPEDVEKIYLDKYNRIKLGLE
ncbi:MAG: hypothetical protein N2Z85_02580 [Patescibacteria group bacterium]|nr:hypothetical protein [Patescibacteria group bacterium]